MLKANENNIKTQDGFIMAVSLALLLVLTIIGIAGISSTTVENMLAGNIRVKTKHFYEGEHGVQLGQKVTDAVVSRPTLGEFKAYLTAQEAVDLNMELRVRHFDPTDNLHLNNADIEFDSSDGTTVTVDIDLMYNCDTMGGGGRQFASAYSGVASGSAGARTVTCYRVNSKSSDGSGANAAVGTVFQRVSWE